MQNRDIESLVKVHWPDKKNEDTLNTDNFIVVIFDPVCSGGGVAHM